MDVVEIMESWVTQPGFPVITISSNKVQRKDGGLSYTETQKRFARGLTSEQLKNDYMKG